MGRPLEASGAGVGASEAPLAPAPIAPSPRRIPAARRDAERAPAAVVDGRDRVARLVRVHGRVQGVGFRYWTSLCAGNLGIKGYVRNITDGTVEALLVGRMDCVARMISLCEEGPEEAEVTRVETGAPRPGQRFDLESFKRLKTIAPDGDL